MFDTLTHGALLQKTAEETEAEISAVHKRIEEISERNEWRVLQSYRKHKVSDTHLRLQPDTVMMISDEIHWRRSMLMCSEERRDSCGRKSFPERMRFQSRSSVC